jgi:regulator of replication initiation timing
MPTNAQPVGGDTCRASLSELLARAEDALQRAAWAIKRNDQLQAESQQLSERLCRSEIESEARDST